MKLIGLTLLFALTACLYASVGFGGGSTYSALLVASGAEYSLIPIIALSCNIAVVSGNTLRYSHFGNAFYRPARSRSLICRHPFTVKKT